MLTYPSRKYPDCSRVGSAEDMGELAFMTPDGHCRNTTKLILTLDDDFTGVIYAYSLIVAVPVEGDQKWPIPGAWLETPDIEGAKRAVLQMTAIMNQTRGMNIKHLVLRIFIGADLITSKVDAANTEPTITKLEGKLSKAFKASNKQISRSARSQPDQWRGMLRPMMFGAVLRNLAEKYPGCTVWDEGELRFNVGDDIYPHPTRLLVARRFEDMTTDIEADHFKAITPMSGESDFKLLRNLNTRKDPGGIVAVALLVSIGESEPWPQVGTYEKNPAMLAAVNALADLVKKWNREGKVQRCLFEVHMGVDGVRNKLVGEKFDAVPMAQDESNIPVKNFGDLEAAFHVKLEEQNKHELFQSESQFQAIKRMINERAAQNPERYDAMLPTIALESATRFLQMNFPDCEVSDEGEFSATIDSQIVRIPNTRLVIAKEKGKEKHNVIAALYAVFSPNGEGWAATRKTWLDTKEMKAADDALLELLKKWYLEEKIAEDCMAQVIMGTDATIYRFVDGVRFEDYSDERMAQIKWG